jgi:hypothetical protein
LTAAAREINAEHEAFLASSETTVYRALDISPGLVRMMQKGDTIDA